HSVSRRSLADPPTLRGAGPFGGADRLSGPRPVSDSPAECLDQRTGAVHIDGGHENRKVGAGRAKRRELFPTPGEWSEQAHGVEQPVAQRGAPAAFLHLIRLGPETARAEQPLKKRESREYGEIAAGHLALLFHVVTDVRGNPDGNVHLTEPLGPRAPALEPCLALRDAGGGPEERHEAVGQLAGQLDSAGREGRDRHGQCVWGPPLRDVGLWPFALGP